MSTLHNSKVILIINKIGSLNLGKWRYLNQKFLADSRILIIEKTRNTVNIVH